MKLVFNFIFVVATASFGLNSCSTTEFSKIDEDISCLNYSTTQTLQVGKTTIEAAQKQCGTPDQQLLTKDKSHNLFIYVIPSNHHPKTVITFDKKTGFVSKVLWNTEGDKMERDLDYFKKSFKGANFVRRDAGWFADSYSDEEYYEDLKLGVRITYIRTSKAVWSVERFIPMSVTTPATLSLQNNKN